MEIKISAKTNNRTKFHFYSFLLMVYFAIAPFEDLLTGSAGTVAKYLALVIAFFGVLSSGFSLKLGVDKHLICILYLIVLTLVSCLWATDSSVAWGRSTAYILVPGFAVFISQLDFSKAELEAIKFSAIIGGIAVVIYLTVNNLLDIKGVMRLQLTAGNDQNNFAALMFLPFALSVERVLTKKGFLKAIYCLLSALFVYIVFMTGSRGALLAIALMFFALILFSNYKSKVKILAFSIIFLLVAFYFVIPMLPQNITERLFSRETYEVTYSTKENRLVFWGLAFKEIIPQSIPLGVGAGCTSLWLGRHFSVDRGMHNTYINMLCEFGVFGLPVFLFMLFNIFIVKLKNKKVFELALFIGICSIIFFLDAFSRKFFWNVIMLLMISDTVERK